MAKEENNNFEDKAKFIILAVAVVAVLGGTFALFWQVNQQNKTTNPENISSDTKKEIEDLNKKIEELNAKLDEAGSAEVEQTTVSQKIISNNGTVAGASSQVGGKINLNTASTADLDTLDGIGATYAQRIIEYREANGGFKTIEEIKNIKGIGDKTFEKIKDQITI